MSYKAEDWAVLIQRLQGYADMTGVRLCVVGEIKEAYTEAYHQMLMREAKDEIVLVVSKDGHTAIPSQPQIPLPSPLDIEPLIAGPLSFPSGREMRRERRMLNRKKRRS